MKLSFSTRGWNDLSWDTWLDTAQEMKFTGIEVYNLFKFPQLTGKGGPFHPHRLAATIRQLRDRKLTIPCLDSSLDLSQSIADGDLVAGLIRTAQDTHVPYVVCWASRGDDQGEELLRRNMEELRLAGGLRGSIGTRAMPRKRRMPA